MSHRTEDLSRRYCDHMMGKANVVGVAGGDDKLLVLVTEKRPLDALAADDVVDPLVEGVETDVVEVGTIEPRLAPGDSIGLDTTGTLGGFVTDEAGRLYALTNNHVAANSNLAAMLSPIHSPGPHDGLGARIGALARYEPIYFDRDNLIDAALIRLDDGLPVDAALPLSTTTARTGWRVRKRGRTSGLTEGEVIGRDATVAVNFGAQGSPRFVGQLLTTYMLDPGDSGSVLLSASGYPCGLGFAGSDRVSIHTPINLVLRTLAVRFAPLAGVTVVA